MRNIALTHLGEVRTTLVFALTPEDWEKQGAR